MSDPELKWWHVRWRPAARKVSRAARIIAKIAGALCLVAAIGSGVLYFIQPWLGVRWLARDPMMSMVPADLPTRAQAALTGATVDVHGVRVSLPDGEAAGGMRSASVSDIPLRNGGILIVRDASEDDAANLEAMIRDERTRQFARPEEMRSAFTLMQAAMSMTPQQAKWWKFRSYENRRCESLLTMKALASMPPATSGPISSIYTISAVEYRGFQIGNPEVAPYAAKVEIFDGGDQHFEIEISRQEGQGPVISQAQLNAMLASLRPVNAVAGRDR